MTATLIELGCDPRTLNTVDCINHKRCADKDGYGTIKIAGKGLRLHRYTYCLYNNVTMESISGLQVRHTCDNPSCINPKHLLIGSHQDNMNDKVQRNRQTRGDVHGRTKLTSTQVKYIREHCKPRDKVHGVLPLSRQFGVSTTAIRYARDGKNWKLL